MTKYDKIWVPAKSQGFAFRDKEGDTPSIVAGPVIVLTIEELRELWNLARSLPDMPGVFELHLKSKGVEL